MEKTDNIFEIDFNSFFHDDAFYECEMHKTFLYRRINNLENIMHDSGKKLYFVMFEDMSKCIELESGMVFFNISEPNSFVKRFYNEELGLYMLVPTNYKDYKVNLEEMCISLSDRKYRKRVLSFLQMYKRISLRRLKLMSKGQITLRRVKKKEK